MTGGDRQALDIARGLATAGVPVFVAYPDPEGKTPSGRATGYRLPKDWERTTANPAYVDAWRPGRALVAVMGCGIDLVDIDPRNGGYPAALDGIMPEVVGVAASPSGGEHRFVRSMGVRSRDSVLPGIDVKAGGPGGDGRGFAFIAPTVRVSKATGEPVSYRWITPPDLSRLNGSAPSGGRLAELVRKAHGSRAQQSTGLGFVQPGGHSEGWTDPDIAQLIREGIPRGEVQQPVLRDVVARLTGQGYDWVVCWGIWQAIVDRTTLTKPEWPWAEADFSDMYDSAVRKYGARPRQAENAAAAQSTPDAGDLAALAGIAADFTPVDWHAAWDAKPAEIQWLIEPLIEAGQSVALYAKPGTGKSLIALECAAALAAGRPVLGNPARDLVTVVYVDAENRQPSLVERLQAFGYEPADLGRLVLYSFPSIAALDSLLGGQQILALAVTRGAAIVIIDTTSRVVAGKENDADTYLAFYRHTVVPLRARGIALLRIDHPGKDVTRGARGSSAKQGDVDAEWLLSRTSELSFVLDRQKERENHGAAWLNLRRCSEPLRHAATVTGASGRAGEIAAQLDWLHVPSDAGRMVAAKALREAGIKVTNADLAEAIRWRKRSADLDQAPPPDEPAEPIRRAPDRSDRSVSDPDEPHRSVRPTYRDGPADRSAPDEAALATLGETFGQLTILDDDGEAAQTGPCARCRKPCNRYGDGGRPLCDDCSKAKP